jgi:hypothetical protein
MNKQFLKVLTVEQINSRQNVIKTFVNNIDMFLKIDREAECVDHSEKLKIVVLQHARECKLYKFLVTFAHSNQCLKVCDDTCLMFRRVRNHLIKNYKSSQQHKCSVLKMYSQILKLHVDICIEEECGISLCKTNKEKRREIKVSQVLPCNFALVEQLFNQPHYLTQHLNVLHQQYNDCLDLSKQKNE